MNKITCSAEADLMKRTYYVVNDNGDLAGHDMDILTAQDCLSVMQEKEPDAGWELFDSNKE